jgi:hypothetical protein
MNTKEAFNPKSPKPRARLEYPIFEEPLMRTLSIKNSKRNCAGYEEIRMENCAEIRGVRVSGRCILMGICVFRIPSCHPATPDREERCGEYNSTKGNGDIVERRKPGKVGARGRQYTVLRNRKRRDCAE